MLDDVVTALCIALAVIAPLGLLWLAWTYVRSELKQRKAEKRLASESRGWPADES